MAHSTHSVSLDLFSLAGQLSSTRRLNPGADTTELEMGLAAAKLAAQARKILTGAPALDQAHLDALMDVIRQAGEDRA